MSGRPTPDELAEAIEELLSGELLSGEILPALDDHRLPRSDARGAQCGRDPSARARRSARLDDTAAHELATRIRKGNVPPGTLARVKAEVTAKLQIDSPHYLGRCDSGTRSG